MKGDVVTPFSLLNRETEPGFLLKICKVVQQLCEKPTDGGVRQPVHFTLKPGLGSVRGSVVLRQTPGSLWSLWR